jgi:SAM-dependent methyltransferase
MKARYKDLNVEWEVMDVRDMALDSCSFDIAIDKATMDSMFHGSMWDPPDDVRTNIDSYLSEVVRVLVPGGIFLYITYRQPHFIKPLLARELAWDLKVETLPDRPGGGVFEYFAYVMKKHGTSEGSLRSSGSQASLNSSETSAESMA